MPSLASMRSIDQTETFQPLGPAVKPESPGQPLPVNKPTSTPGVVEMPDGKLATELPLPPLAGFVGESFGTRTGRFSSPKARPVNKAKSPHADKTLQDALRVAVQSKDYPHDGVAWTSHDPARDKPPARAGWVVLRNGSLRCAGKIRSWGAGSDIDDSKHSPNYDVVGWK